MSKPKATITCRAAVCWKAGDSLTIEEIQVEPPKPGEVRIKIFATGICYSDVSGSSGKVLGGLKFPIIVGHEASAIVESVGDEKNSSFKVGDHVIPIFLPQCNQCRVCKDENANTCLEFMGPLAKGLQLDGTTRYSCRGEPIYSFLGCSTFSEYSVVNEISLAKIHQDAPLDKCWLISCGFGTGYGSAFNKNAGNVTKGSTCCVFGLGTLGLACIMGCKDAGAKRIIGVDINSEKFKVAAELGATDFINPKELNVPFEEYISQHFDAIEYTFECVGRIATMKQAFETSAVGNGVCTVIGVAETEAHLEINPINFLVGRTIKGTLFGGYKSKDSVPKLVEEYMEGKFNLDKFITHTIRLEEVNEGFNLLRSGKSIRTVIRFD